MPNEVRKGYCIACPFDMTQHATHEAYNLGCLPSTQEIQKHIGDSHSWPCHSEPDKVCCGNAIHRHLPLKPMEGVHAE